MFTRDRNAQAIGALMLLIIVVGVLSISPEVDSAEFLMAAAANASKVTLSAVYQFMIAIVYVAIAVMIYPVVREYGPKQALGYLSLTLIAATLIIVGTVTLSSILLLSQELEARPVQDTAMADAIGLVFKISRDFINHGYMVLALCLGKLLVYALFFKSGLIPKALSIIGIIAALISMGASLFVLFQVIDVVTTKYIVLNMPTALHEIALAFWLIFKGFAASPAERVEHSSP